MLGVILAGGIGTRLMPLTKVTNKHLLPVYDQPMIYYPIQTLTKAGINEIVIVTGKEHSGNFMTLLSSGREFGARFAYVLQEGAGGIAEAIGLVEPYARGSSIVVMLGDNIVFDDLTDEVRGFKSGCRIFLKEVADPERFGVPEIDDSGKIRRIIEKPANPPTKFAVTGIYFYDSTVFDRIKRLKPSERGELEVTDLNNSYLADGKLSHGFIKGPWLDAGTIENLYQATLLVRKLRVDGREP
ncbi:MAG: sugar phosphate nucleotidyltransferase [Candidatus Thermoplasmatota archaeon]|nr:sugar phosphate nucleotidyltransferase [Candidatus Thermoplasmatota archaeon]MCL5731427.1 sugar phosphate nucleotidyltransferase [Candidatus Thermoplasmatota archaeon]